MGRLGVLCCGVLVGAVSWGAGVGATEQRPLLRSGQYQGANVLFVEFTNVRRDHVGSYGYTRPTTPRLDAMAARSVRFDHVVAAAPWCVPGKLAIWTGLYPSAHHVTNKFALNYSVGGEPQIERAKLAEQIATFPELLKRQAGYTLVGFTGGAGVSGISGLGRGFDRYVDDGDFQGLDHTVPLALEWLRTERKEPFFMFLQGYSAHGQAIPPPGGYTRVFAKDYTGPLTASPEEYKRIREESLKSRFHPAGPQIKQLDFSPEDQAFYLAIYDEKLQRMDQRVGELLDALDALGLMDHTILVLYSGHGDEYFDRGFLDHGTTLYEETIHVPLFVAVPGMQEGRVVESQIRTIDLFPTVFDLLGLPSPPVTGVSVVPALNGRRMDLVGLSETEYRLFTHKSALVTADHRYKLIYTHDSRQTELYDLVKDPQERKNLVADRPQLAKQLQDQLMALLALSSAHHPQAGVPRTGPMGE